MTSMRLEVEWVSWTFAYEIRLMGSFKSCSDY
jgi:hypothetical protein